MADERGVAVLDFIRYLARVLPRVAILENVRGMALRHKPELDRIIDLIKAIVDPLTKMAPRNIDE